MVLLLNQVRKLIYTDMSQQDNPESPGAGYKQVLGAYAESTNQLHTNITADVQNGVVLGIKQLATDKEFLDTFWQSGFVRLAKHTQDGASQWLGKRILTWLIGLMVSAGVIYLVKSGAIR